MRDNFQILEYQREVDKYLRKYWETGCSIYFQWAQGYIQMMIELKEKMKEHERF